MIPPSWVSDESVSSIFRFALFTDLSFRNESIHLKVTAQPSYGWEIATAPGAIVRSILFLAVVPLFVLHPTSSLYLGH